MTQLVKRSPGKELARWAGLAPLRELRALEERMDRLFGDAFPRFGALSPRWSETAGPDIGEPAVEIYESDKEFVLKAELPGISEKDVHVSMDDGLLTIPGERKEEKETEKDTLCRMERFSGNFSRSFVLPPSVKPDGIRATFKDGVMRLSMPKRESARTKVTALVGIERSYGCFRRSFTLPHAVDRDAIKAACKDGVLKVVLPKKKEEAKPWQIEIDVGPG